MSSTVILLIVLFLVVFGPIISILCRLYLLIRPYEMVDSNNRVISSLFWCDKPTADEINAEFSEFGGLRRISFLKAYKLRKAA